MAMIYRAYFAMISTPLINSKGKNTSAVLGFTNSLLKILDEENPEHIAVCCDTSAPTFRHKEFPEYKAQRQEIPSDMPWQIGKVKEIVRALNIPLIEVDGYEADDIIGTLAKQAEKEKVVSYMVTPDKDFMQLVSDKVFMYKPARNLYGSKMSEVDIIDKEGVFKKFGVEPEKVIEVLGLMGDSSDNIPGIKGVGEKTATSLIQEFGSIDNIYKNIDKITKPKLKENILTHKDEALLSHRLVTIKTDVPLKLNFHDLIKKDADSGKILSLFEELEFKNLIKKFSKEENGAEAGDKKGEKKESKKELKIKGTKIEKVKVDIKAPPKIIKTISDVKHNYSVIKNKEEFLKLVKKLSGQRLVCFGTETDTQDCMNSNLAGMSFSFEENEAYYVPVSGQKFDKKNKKGKEEQSLFDTPVKESEEKNSGIELNFAIENLKPVLESKKIKFVGQNLKHDYLVMRNYGIEMNDLYFDTLIGAFIYQPDGSHSMDVLSEKYLSYKPISMKDITRKRKR